MKICIITVSNSEIISNEKNDTISLISSQLYKNGQDVVLNLVVKANSEVISSSLKMGMEKSDCVLFLCDNEFEKLYMCKRLLCDVFSCKMINSLYAKHNIDEYSRIQNVPLKKEDSTYAQMPEIARTIKNPFSPFQGCLCEQNNKSVFLLPLLHDELQHIFFSSVLPYILKSRGSDSSTFVLKTFGIKLNEMTVLLRDLIKNKYNIEVVCNEYLLLGEVVVNVPKGVRKDLAENLVKNIYEKILPYVYSDKDETQSDFIYSILSLHKQKVSFAEDFTAGNMTATLYENLENAKDILDESYIGISNNAKSKIFGVQESIFKKSDIDYAEIAYQMALGVLENSKADVVVSNCGDISTGDCVFAIGNKEGIHVFNQKVVGSNKQKIIMATNAIFFELIKKLKLNDFYLGKTTI